MVVLFFCRTTTIWRICFNLYTFYLFRCFWKLYISWCFSTLPDLGWWPRWSTQCGPTPARSPKEVPELRRWEDSNQGYRPARVDRRQLAQPDRQHRRSKVQFHRLRVPDTRAAAWLGSFADLPDQPSELDKQGWGRRQLGPAEEARECLAANRPRSIPNRQIVRCHCGWCQVPAGWWAGWTQWNRTETSDERRQCWTDSTADRKRDGSQSWARWSSARWSRTGLGTAFRPGRDTGCSSCWQNTQQRTVRGSRWW